MLHEIARGIGYDDPLAVHGDLQWRRKLLLCFSDNGIVDNLPLLDLDGALGNPLRCCRGICFGDVVSNMRWWRYVTEAHHVRLRQVMSLGPQSSSICRATSTGRSRNDMGISKAWGSGLICVPVGSKRRFQDEARQAENGGKASDFAKRWTTLELFVDFSHMLPQKNVSSMPVFSREPELAKQETQWKELQNRFWGGIGSELLFFLLAKMRCLTCRVNWELFVQIIVLRWHCRCLPYEQF